MNEPSDSATLKWYHMRRTRLTPEYFGGLLAGTGLGAILTTSVLRKVDNDPEIYFSEVMLIAFPLIGIGAWMAQKAQSARWNESASSK